MLPVVSENNEFIGLLDVSRNLDDKTLRFATRVAPTEDDDFGPFLRRRTATISSIVDIPLGVIIRHEADNMAYFVDENHARQSLESRIMNHLPSEIRKHININNIRIEFERDSRSTTIIIAKLYIKVARLTDELLEMIFDMPSYQPI